jgi:hypothetical protein
MGLVFSDNIDRNVLVASLEKSKTPELLRSYLKVKSGEVPLTTLLETAYDTLAGYMQVDLLQVINEYCDIRTFLGRKIKYKEKREIFYWITDGASLPFIVASNGWVDVVEYILSLNIDINAFFGGDMNMLHAACYHGKIDVLRVLLAYGADITIPCERYGDASAIMLAVSTKSLACFDELVIYGASLKGCFQRDKGDITIFLRLFDLLALTDDDILRLGKSKSYGNPKSRTMVYYREFEYLYKINKETMIRDDDTRVLKKYLNVLVLNSEWKTFSQCKNYFMRQDESNEKFFAGYTIPEVIDMVEEVAYNGEMPVRVYTEEEEMEEE